MSTMTDLFESLNRERAALLDAIKDLPGDFLERKGVVGEWSIKNVLGHLVAWESAVTDFLPERIATGARPAIFAVIGDDEDGWNARDVASREHLTPREQLDEFEQSRQALLQVLRALGEETLNRDHPWKGWDGTVAAYVLDSVGGHEDEHREAVLAGVRQLRDAS
ncbi:MAG TPA: DinB family protein [Ktedonobacteraceae bacterium]